MGKVRKNIAARKTRDGDEIVGWSRDGIAILKPAVPPTHFSTAEIRATIAQHLRETRENSAVGRKVK